MIAGLYYAFAFNNKATMAFINNEAQTNDATTIITSLDKEQSAKVFNYLESIDVKNKTAETSDLEHLLSQYQDDEAKYAEVVKGLPINDSLKYESGFSLFKHKIPMWIFLICFGWISRLGIQKKLVFNSAFRINLLSLHDGRIKRLELDLFHDLVVNRVVYLLYL